MTVLAESNWHTVFALADLPKGERKEAELPDGRLVLVVHTDDGIFACCADCPHQDTPLIEGSVDGTRITCPLHFWQWDLRDGSARGIAEVPLPTFPVRVQEDKVEIGLS